METTDPEGADHGGHAGKPEAAQPGGGDADTVAHIRTGIAACTVAGELLAASISTVFAGPDPPQLQSRLLGTYNRVKSRRAMAAIGNEVAHPLRP